MKHQVVLVPPELVPDAFYLIKDYVFNLSKRTGGRVVVEQVYLAVASGQHRLYVVFDEKSKAKAFFTLIEEMHGIHRGLVIYWLGGENMKDWIGLIRDKVEEQAEHAHVDFVRFETPRKGWESVVSSLGMEQVGSIFEKRYPRGQQFQSSNSHDSGRPDDDDEPAGLSSGSGDAERGPRERGREPAV